MTTLEALQENVEIMLPANGLALKLRQAERENRKLIVKLGFDPTAPDLHLGHAVVLKKLKQFQDLGHQVVIIVGSFTAQIGDPTGKNKSRKPLSKEEVLSNAHTYLEQLAKVIDVAKCQVRFNADWLEGLGFNRILELLSSVTVAQLLQRNDFHKRFTENTPIAMHELMYPILQGFDSLQIKADIEMGGTDQLFNCTMGRQLQESHQQEPQVVLCMPLLKGLDGKEKMSKSLQNIIGLTDTPEEMFGKTMSIPDSLIEEYLTLTTDFSPQEKQDLLKRLLAGENPMHLKKVIATNIITQYHDGVRAVQAQLFFEKQFQQKQFEEKEFTQISLSAQPIDSLPGITLLEMCKQLKPSESKSQLRRLIEAGSVSVNGVKVTDPLSRVDAKRLPLKLKIGRRDYFEIIA